MSNSDTVTGGPKQAFPSTVWSEVLAAGDPGNSRYRERLSELIQLYWKPVYAYVRGAWRKSVEDAKDLTQAFFAHLLERGYLARVRSERGSFRGYLKQALKHFLIDAERASAARRPANPLFSLDATRAELDRLVAATPDESPEQTYDREWFRCLWNTAVETLRESLHREGKAVYFEVFRVYLIDRHPSAEKSGPVPLAGGAPSEALPTYAEVGAQFGLNETTVSNYLRYCRKELRRLLKDKIRDYVETEGDLDREVKELLGG